LAIVICPLSVARCHSLDEHAITDKGPRASDNPKATVILNATSLMQFLNRARRNAE
jgi:hypothetical protein